MRIKINKSVNFDTTKPPLIIAEISGNHNGSKTKFLKLIKKAHESGADLIKIQTYEPEDITLKENGSSYLKIKKGIWKGKQLWDLYSKACTPFKWHHDAFKLAKKLKANLFSTPFSERAVSILEKYKVDLYKISSFEITDLNLIQTIAKTKKPILISTGLANFKEINTALKIIKRYHNKIIILYCVSGYPTPNSEANVKTLNLYKKKFKKYMIGISDHTNDIYSSIAATSLGVVAIEKHFKLNKTEKTVDSKFSITPQKLKQLKEYSQNIHTTLGFQTKNLKKSEKNSLFFRRSIFSKKNIKKGEKFNKRNIICLRPKVGISSNNYFKILNKKSKKFIKKNSPIFKSFISDF